MENNPIKYQREIKEIGSGRDGENVGNDGGGDTLK